MDQGLISPVVFIDVYIAPYQNVPPSSGQMFRNSLNNESNHFSMQKDKHPYCAYA